MYFNSPYKSNVIRQTNVQKLYFMGALNSIVANQIGDQWDYNMTDRVHLQRDENQIWMVLLGDRSPS